MSQTTKTTSTEALATEITEHLREHAPQARYQIRQIVEVIGLEASQTLLQEILAIESGEGLMTADGSRRRTPGGVFLHLAKGRLDPETRAKIFPKTWHHKKPSAPASAPHPPALEWA